MTPDPLLRALESDSTDTSDFDLNHTVRSGAAPMLRAAAVLIGIADHAAGARIILTKRASGLKHHPGQIALPGGRVEPSDGSPQAAALREAEEEVGLPRVSVRVIGTLPAHETVTGFSIVPVVGRISAGFAPVPEAGEVEEAFFVPLDHILNLANYRVEQRLWQGAWRRFYVVPYGPHYIWGATARILRGLADRVARCP